MPSTLFSPPTSMLLDNSQQYKIPPIESLATELLISVFHEYAASQPTFIGRLLLVNKRWYTILMHTPTLWTNIVIRGRCFTRESAQKGLVAYVRACIERSANMPLKLNIILSPEDEDPGRFTSCLTDEVFTIDFPEYSRAPSIAYLPLVRCQPTQYGTLCQSPISDALTVLSANLSALERLEVLDFGLPSWHLISKPILFSLNPLNLRKCRIWEGCSLEHSITSGNAEFPMSLARVTTLDLYQPFPLKSLPISTNILQHLSIGVSEKWDNIGGISLLRALKTLTLYRDNYFSHLAKRVVASTAWAQDFPGIDLPDLCKLTVMGAFPGIRLIEFKLPSLKTLDIITKGLRPSQDIPRVWFSGTKMEFTSWVIGTCEAIEWENKERFDESYRIMDSLWAKSKQAIKTEVKEPQDLQKLILEFYNNKKKTYGWQWFISPWYRLIGQKINN